jgi:hypothetical protein
VKQQHEGTLTLLHDVDPHAVGGDHVVTAIAHGREVSLTAERLAVGSLKASLVFIYGV